MNGVVLPGNGCDRRLASAGGRALVDWGRAGVYLCWSVLAMMIMAEVREGAR
jgi:hypothetical protein